MHDLEALKTSVRGRVLESADHGFDDARAIWNALIDKRPAVIVQAAGVADVIAAARFGEASGLPISVRGGGHNVAGTALADDGLMIDLSPMRAVHVDPIKRTARVQGGATLYDLDHETSAFGLVTPGGVVSSTGVAGLTLGGGFGWLARLHGLAADNLVAVDLVTADGALITASAESHPDLFWGLRGGSGNFGIATSFLFRLHDLPDPILFGPTVFRLEDAGDVLRHYGAFIEDAPRECCVWADLLTAPPLPFLEERHHGAKVLTLMQCYAGDPAVGEAVLAPIRDFGQSIGHAVGPMRYADAQQILDQTYEKGLRNYWKSSNFKRLPDVTIDKLVSIAATMPTPETDMLICQLGGKIADVASDATAFPHRDAGVVVTPGVRWRSSADDARCLAWIEETGASLDEDADGGAYVNFIAERGGRSEAAYGSNLARLEALKRRYDPKNLFRQNQNIRPAA
ncbi:MAG: FAD-binding oxidoreductase [Pseudomonadota bacterium]